MMDAPHASSARPRYEPVGLQPSAQQIAIQMSMAPALIVQANAGAAKTTTLALRIAQALASGVPPDRILVLTFTPAACEAMRAALKRVGQAQAARRLRVQTFDAFAADMLASVEPARVPRLDTPEQAAPWVRQVLARHSMPVDAGFIERLLGVARRLKGSLALERAWWEGRKADAALAEELQVDPDLLRVLVEFEALREPRRDGVDAPRWRSAGDATFDLARQLGAPEAPLLAGEIPAWPAGLRLLVVDEMHDLNAAAHLLVQQLLRSTDALFCGVGDIDQVIHATAGAEPRFMRPDVDLGGRPVKTLPLTATYRFGRTLAAMAGRLTDKPYASQASVKTSVDLVPYLERSSGDGERRLVQALQAWKGKHKLQDVAVLLRHPSQAVAIENALIDAGLRYELRGLVRYTEQPEVLLVRALLAVATGRYESLVAVQRVPMLVDALVSFCEAELPHDRSDTETQAERLAHAVEQIQRDPSAALRPFIEQLQRSSHPQFARRMARAAAIVGADAPGWFDAFTAALDLPAWADRHFIERARRAEARTFLTCLKQAAAGQGVLRFFDTLGDRRTATRNDNTLAQRAAADRRQTLTLGLIDAVKGLEFEHVILPGLAEGSFPDPMAAEPWQERNLFYVGITRARTRLTLLVGQERPSRFVAEMAPSEPDAPPAALCGTSAATPQTPGALPRAAPGAA